MAYNLVTIRNQIKSRLSDENFDNSLLNDFVNDEQREVFNYYDLPFNRTSRTFTLSQDDFSENLPANHQRTKGLRITAPAGYDFELTQYYLPYDRFKQYYREPQHYSTSVPKYWSIYSTAIKFSWAADKDYTMEHDYLITPDELAEDNDVPQLPEEFREILVLGGLVRALEANDDNDIAQYQQGKKNLQVQAMLKRYNPQQSGRVEVIRNSARGL